VVQVQQWFEVIVDFQIGRGHNAIFISRETSRPVDFGARRDIRAIVYYQLPVGLYGWDEPNVYSPGEQYRRGTRQRHGDGE
jgi:hypothetical protein